MAECAFFVHYRLSAGPYYVVMLQCVVLVQVGVYVLYLSQIRSLLASISQPVGLFGELIRYSNVQQGQAL
jgi:hypothetical protein